MIPILNYTMQIGGSEWIWLIFLAVLLLFGPTKLPELARGLGKAMGEFQKGKAEIEREIRLATAATDTSKKPLLNANPPKEIKPVKTILEEIMAEAEAVIARTAGLAAEVARG